MVGDVSTKYKYRDAILNQSKATSDELERTYEAFERFGVKIVMDLVR